MFMLKKTRCYSVWMQARTLNSQWYYLRSRALFGNNKIMVTLGKSVVMPGFIPRRPSANSSLLTLLK